MIVNAFCLCNETLVFEQLIDGVWVNISDLFDQVDEENWDFTPTQEQIDSGSIDFRYCCGTSCSESTINFDSGPCIPTPNTLGPMTFTFNEGDTMSFPFECSECPQTTFFVWQQLNNGFYGAPVLAVPEGLAASAAYDGSCWRFGCFDNEQQGSWSSLNPADCFNVQVVPVVGDDNVARSDADGVHTPGAGSATETFCLDNCAAGAVYRWQMRIEQAGPLTAPQLDANDPALTGAWFDVPEWDGLQCIDVEIKHEDLPNGNNATDLTLHDDMDETFYFEVRGSCADDGTYSAAQPVTIIYEHIDDGVL